jgi:hypothetical protein
VPCSVLSCAFTDDPLDYYCVGTAYMKPDEVEPNQGRILVFAVEDHKLMLVAEKETKGKETIDGTGKFPGRAPNVPQTVPECP